MPTQDSATRPAYLACTHFMQPILQGQGLVESMAGRDADAMPRLAALTSWAECMRRHDINMLDPTPAGELNLGTVPGVTSDFGRYSPQFHAGDTALPPPSARRHQRQRDRAVMARRPALVAGLAGAAAVGAAATVTLTGGQASPATTQLPRLATATVTRTTLTQSTC